MKSTKKKMSVESRFALWTCRDLGQIGTYQGTSPEGGPYARYDVDRNYTGRYGGRLEIRVAKDRSVAYIVPFVYKTWQKALAALLARARSGEVEVPGLVSPQEAKP